MTLEELQEEYNRRAEITERKRVLMNNGRGSRRAWYSACKKSNKAFHAWFSAWCKSKIQQI